jgi:hypothetical protein
VFFKRKRLAYPADLHHRAGQSSALACTLKFTIYGREGYGAQQLHYWVEFNTAPSPEGASAEGGAGGYDHHLHAIQRNHRLADGEEGLIPGSFADSTVKPSCPTCFFHGVGGVATATMVKAFSWRSIIC